MKETKEQNCIPKYLVLKEFVYVNDGREYDPGEIFETADSVKGLIHRGILKPYEEPPCPPCPPECPTKDCLEERLEKSPVYKTNKKAKIVEPEELDLPKVDTSKLDKYLPAAALALAKIDADKKVKEASETLKPKRKTKQVEVDISMNNLVEEIDKPKRGRKRKGG